MIISHVHWDHMGGIDLFPNATVWIQREEYRYYTGDAWQPGEDHGGVDPDDVAELLEINLEGRLRLVDGDPPVVLASDNVYLYRNLEERAASATFSEADHAANVAAQERMEILAGSTDRIVPGRDALQFERFPTDGRIARIR